MEQTTLPVGEDYCTYGWAAEHLKVSVRTVSRLVANKRLRKVKARTGPREAGNHHGYLFTAEVQAYRLALTMVGRK